jgi:hypothetical protein
MQGFDEFMNLVIDDAVEVKQATKTEGESRRQLGELAAEMSWDRWEKAHANGLQGKYC